MQVAKLLKKLFPNARQKELSIIWDRVMTPLGFDLIALDEVLQETYGEYKGSMQEFVENKFGKDLASKLLGLIK